MRNRADDPLFAGGGELGRAMAAHDWSATPLGTPDTWPVELRSVVRIMLTSRFSMWMAWGPDLTMFYNDAYRRDTLRAKHPWAVGRPAREVWAEIWDDIGPRIDSVLATGEATWDSALLLYLERAGYVEESYHTFSYSPLADGTGAVVGMLCVVSEDTERVIGERRLRILSELGDVSALTAPTTVEAARAAVDVLGRGRADVPFAAVYLTEDGGRRARLVSRQGLRDDPRVVEVLGRDTDPDAPLWQVLDTGAPLDVDGLATTHAGAFLPAGTGGAVGSGADPDRAVVVPLTGGGGDVVGAVVAGVSPLRALDEEYRRFLDLVGAGIGTAVADARAYQAQRTRADELAELDRAKTEFFTGVSHELRTPLTLISGPADDALADLAAPLPPAQRERVELIARNSGRLRRLVDALLEFSRLEDGRAAPQRVPVDLAALTRGIVESFAPAVTRAGLALDVECPALPAVSVDPTMWEKIVLNLLSNAVKYTLDGGIRVGLERSGGGVALTVTDTGIGVPEADRPLLFQRFHRVAGATGRSHEGSGIGLALVAELTALHGGTAAVDAAPGGGSTFTVTLPPDAVLPDAEPAGPAAPTPAARLYRDEALQWGGADDPPHDAPAEHPARASVLVAEDNADMRRFLAGLLAPHYHVDVVADGRTALHRARTRHPDLVLTDVMMPGLDGFELLAALRAHPATAVTPVLLLSARAGEEAAIEGLAAGADDYLVKPFSSADLLARVRSNLALATVRNQESAWRAALIQALQDGLFVLDAAGTVVETNQAFHDIVGYPTADLPFGTPYPWWPTDEEDADDAAAVRAAHAAILDEGRGRHTLPIRHRDRRRRILAEITVESVGDGAQRRYVGTVNDVTERHRIADRDRLLADAGRILGHPGPLPELLGELVEAAVPLVGGLAAVLLAGPDGRQEVVAVAHARDASRAGIVAKMGVVPPLHELLRADFERGAAFVAPPGTCALAGKLARHDHGPGGGESGGGEPVGGEPVGGESLMVPLLLGPRVLGTLVLCDTPHRPDAMDTATAEELGRRLALAIQARRSVDRERRRHGITAALAAAGTVAGVARVVAGGLVDLTGASSVTALLRRADGMLETAHHHGAPPPLRERFGVDDPADLPPVTAAVRTARAQWVRAEEFAHAALPLLVDGRVTGVLSATFPGPRPFDDDEQAFLQSLAAEAALAIERAALADARRELAETLQHSLLPPALPRHDRLALAARYLPASSDSRTGGDWYDVLTLDEDRVAIVVGDVVGQGPAAAAVMGQLRSALSAYLLQSGSPAEALTWVDRYSHLVAGARASTAVCVVLDTRTGGLCWARAGHLPPLVVRAGGGGTEYLDDASGTVLGVRGAPPFTEGSSVLAPGDTLVLYTDGLVERRDEILDAGLDRLATAASTAQPVDGLVPTILLAALDGAGPVDDVALIVARLRPAPLTGTRPAVGPTLSAVRREVDAWIAATELPEELGEDLQLALGEAVANSVEHAYAGRAPGEVRYRVAQDASDDVRVEVADDGTWRPPGDPGYRGRGLLVIRALGEDVRLDHDGTGTRVALTLRAPGGPARSPSAAPAAGSSASGGPVEPVLHLAGTLDVETVPDLRAAVLDAVRGGPVVLDLREVEHLASAGIGLLMEAHAVAGAPVRLRVTPGSPVARVLALTGVDLLIESVENRAVVAE